MAVAINFISINVNSLYRDATVSIGEVNQPGWSSHGKNNYGNGQYIGTNVAANIITGVLDNDLIDSPINDSDNVPSAQNQQV